MLHPTRIRGFTMKKILTILLLTISMVGAFSSCQKECTCEPKEQSLILGKWKLESTTAPNHYIVSLDFLTGGIVKIVDDNWYTNGAYFSYNISGDILVINCDEYHTFSIKQLDNNQLYLKNKFYEYKYTRE